MLWLRPALLLLALLILALLVLTLLILAYLILNGIFGLCLGCELSLILRRATTR